MRHPILPLLTASLLAACAAAPAPHQALGAPPPALAADLAPAPLPTLAAEAGSAQMSLTAELQAPGMRERGRLSEPRSLGPGSWAPGVPLMQGYIGAALLDRVEVDGGNVPPTDGSDKSLSQFPVIGGGAQWKLGGERLDFGVEGMLGFGWRANGGAFASGGGGAVIAVSVDMLLFELYGGPFVSTFLGDKLRAYAAAGPMMQWANYDQSGPSGTDGSGNGFGTGLYARTGLELITSPSSMIGLGVRWVDSTIDLGGDVGDLDLEGYQVVLTVSRGL